MGRTDSFGRRASSACSASCDRAVDRLSGLTLQGIAGGRRRIAADPGEWRIRDGYVDDRPGLLDEAPVLLGLDEPAKDDRPRRERGLDLRQPPLADHRPDPSGRPPSREAAGRVGVLASLVRSLQGFKTVLELADLEEVHRGDRRRDEDPQPRDAVVEADPVGDDDVEEPADAFHGLEPGEVVGDRDRALLAPPHAAQPAGLGRLGGSFGVVAEAVGPVAQRRHLAGLAVRLRVGAPAAD